MTPPTMKPRANEYDDDPRFDDDDISTVPFVQQSAYGLGLWKQPIKFVPAGWDAANQTPKLDGKTIADQYRAIVFPNGAPPRKEEVYPLCSICGVPIHDSDSHFTSILHQAALPRAPTPSSIDRTRMGLKYLEKYGYDVSAGVGLGANGQGMLYPLLPKAKQDKLGLGSEIEGHEKKKGRGGNTSADVKTGKLDAGKMRKLAEIEKKKHDKLHREFYGNDEVEKYIGLLHD